MTALRNFAHHHIYLSTHTRRGVRKDTKPHNEVQKHFFLSHCTLAKSYAIPQQTPTFLEKLESKQTKKIIKLKKRVTNHVISRFLPILLV